MSNIIQIMPAPGWRAFCCWDPESAPVEFEEFHVVGWGLNDCGNVDLLIVATSDGGKVIPINDANSECSNEHYEKFFDREPTDAEKAEMVRRVQGKRKRNQ